MIMVRICIGILFVPMVVGLPVRRMIIQVVMVGVMMGVMSLMLPCQVMDDPTLDRDQDSACDETIHPS